MNKKENDHRLKSIFLLLCMSILLTLPFLSLDNKIIREKSLTPVHSSFVRYLCPYWKGRLGNQMFEFASLYGIAKENNMNLVVTESDTVFKTFNTSKLVRYFTIHMRKVLCRNATILEYPKSATFVRVTIPQIKFVKINGHLQSWKYFKSVENELRQQFIFKQNIKDHAQKLLSAIKRSVGSDYITVGVHIRRGDMVDKYPVASSEYLRKASDYFRKRFRKVIFVVCTSSDYETQNWTLRNFVEIYKKESVFVDLAPPAVHMYLLSTCDHTVITVGSFGWWIGWLNNGTTIYYDYFDSNKTKNRFTKSDYIYPGWIGIKT